MKSSEKKYAVIGMCHDDYLNFCKKMSLPHYKKDSKVLFFKLCREGKLIKENNKLIYKD